MGNRKERKFRVGHATRIFKAVRKYGTKTEAHDAAKTW